MSLKVPECRELPQLINRQIQVLKNNQRLLILESANHPLFGGQSSHRLELSRKELNQNAEYQ